MSTKLTKWKWAAWIVAGLVALAVIALNFGRGLTQFLDRFVRTPERSLPTTQFGAYEGEAGSYQGGAMLIGAQELSNAGLDFIAFPLAFEKNAAGQLVLASGGKSFVLGPLLSSDPGPGGIPILRFEPGAGDNVRFDIEHSVFGWPTPFRVNFMTGGPTPSWGRAVYYRLRWRKPGGATLEMVWTYDQDYFADSGWREVHTRGGTGGLMRVQIRP